MYLPCQIPIALRNKKDTAVTSHRAYNMEPKKVIITKVTYEKR